MSSILNNMFPSTVNGNIYFNPQYKSTNPHAVPRSMKSTNERQLSIANQLLKRSHVAVNTRMNLNKPLSSRKSTTQGYGDVRKSKYSIVKTGVTESPKKNLYKWENKLLKSELNSPVISGLRVIRNSTPNPLTNGNSYQKVTSNIIVEDNIAKNHFRSSIPFHSHLSKGWFSVPPCNISCVNESLFDLRLCCFISKRFLPPNTLSLNSFQVAVPSTKVEKKADIENTPSFLKLSKHKLIRKPQQPELPTKDPAVVLCTKRKLIRESAPSPKIQKQLAVPSSEVQQSLSSESTNSTESTSAGQSSTLPQKALVVLTDRKLVRETGSNICDCIKKPSTAISSSRLIRVNRNKLIRSSLLQKFTRRSVPNYAKPAQSVLSRMIQYRRRPYPGSSYVLLTRNKLVRRVRFKNRVWQKNSDSSTPQLVPKKSQVMPKVFVAVGKNKLIRKSLFTKTNKVAPKTSASCVSPLKNKLLTLMMNSPGRRVQRFTNHLSRRKLKYLANSSTRISRNRFSNKCKNNKRTLRRRNSVCPVFRRKGKCHKNDINNCSYLHDEKYIMICKNYLKSSCEDKNCLLSHDLIPQKTPVCLHFLNGNCEANLCPFLHVKLDPNSPICVHFLQGYCEAADKCTSWHVYACPQYKSCGKCDKAESCRLPHRDLEYFEGRCSDSDDADEENVIQWRYFEKNKLDEKDLSGEQIIPKRDSLGVLPDYIPL